jgi:hypothetical protein
VTKFSGCVAADQLPCFQSHVCKGWLAPVTPAANLPCHSKLPCVLIVYSYDTLDWSALSYDDTDESRGPFRRQCSSPSPPQACVSQYTCSPLLGAESYFRRNTVPIINSSSAPSIHAPRIKSPHQNNNSLSFSRNRALMSSEIFSSRSASGNSHRTLSTRSVPNAEYLVQAVRDSVGPDQSFKIRVCTHFPSSLPFLLSPSVLERSC